MCNYLSKNKFQADTLSVKSWLTSISTQSTSTQSSLTHTSSVQNLDIILKETPRGQEILNFFNANSTLKDEHRDALINIITESFSQKCMSMTMKDIVKFNVAIGALFPSEDLVSKAFNLYYSLNYFQLFLLHHIKNVFVLCNLIT